MTSRKLAGEDNPIHRAADNIGDMKSTNPENPSVFSSGGAIGRQFNPDGMLGSIPQAVGGPFSKDGIIGGQFDAAKGGIAGTVERAVDGPSQARKPGTGNSVKSNLSDGMREGTFMPEGSSLRGKGEAGVKDKTAQEAAKKVTGRNE